MKEIFQKDFDIERILMAIQLVTGKVVKYGYFNSF
mgnify:CR=1 FL=1